MEMVSNLSKDYLRSQGISYDETEIGLFFQSEGVLCLLMDPSDDVAYIKLCMPSLSRVTAKGFSERLKVFEATNAVNEHVKAVKAYLHHNSVDHSDEIWLSTEIFIGSSPESIDIFPRLLQALHAGRSYLRSVSRFMLGDLSLGL